METTSLRISKDNFLPDIINLIKKGGWKIPRFQREFVWERNKVISLFESMYKGFPIGSFFLWIPPEEYTQYYKDIPELEIVHGSKKYYTHFILDGQQRLTSLYVTLNGLTVRGFDYSRICFNLDTEKFNGEPADEVRNIPVCKILQKNYHEVYNKLSNKSRQENFLNVREIFSRYPFPVIVVEDKSIEDACEIFSRINQGGKRLSIFDLVVAVTWDKDFELDKKIKEFNEGSDGGVKNSFGALDKEIFTETLSLIHYKQCTKSFQIRLKPEHVKQIWPDVVKSLKRSIQFLRSKLNVVSYNYIPYRDMLPLMAYYFYHKKDNEVNSKFLEEWFWKAAFSSRYSVSTFTRIGEDRAYIFDKEINNEKYTINYNINLDAEKIKTIQLGRRTAIGNALILLLIEQKPLSFLDNTPIDIPIDAISEFNKLERHHIFPKKFLRSIGIREKKATDLLLNFALIDSSLNKHISGTPPADYLLKFKEKNPDIKEALRSHFIDPSENSAVWRNSYQEFIDERAELLELRVKSKTGDFGATITEQINSNPPLVVQKLEQKIREIISTTLYDNLGEHWWSEGKSIPGDIKDYANKRMEAEKKQKPYLQDAELKDPNRLLEQINISDYGKIICTNWKYFEEMFGSKEKLQNNIKMFADFRNQISHARMPDPIEKKMGEAAIEWIYRCINEKEEKEIREEEGEDFGPFYINNLYGELKDRVLELDQQIEKVDKKNYKGFRKLNPNMYFLVIRLRTNKIYIQMPVNKNLFSDPEKITEKSTSARIRKRSSTNRQWVDFEIYKKSDLDYALFLIRQAYEYNEEIIQKKYQSQEENNYLNKSQAERKFFDEVFNTAKSMGYKVVKGKGVSLRLPIEGADRLITLFYIRPPSARYEYAYPFFQAYLGEIEDQEKRRQFHQKISGFSEFEFKGKHTMETVLTPKRIEELEPRLEELFKTAKEVFVD